MRRRDLWLLGLLAACDATPAAPTDAGDAGDVAAPDAADVTGADAACTEITAIHSVLPFAITVATGSRTELVLRLARDRRQCPGDYRLTLSAGLGAVPARVTVPLDEGSVTVPFTAGAAPGEGTLRIEAEGTPALTVPVRVRADALPNCAAGQRVTLGALRAGATVEGTLDGASVSLTAPLASDPLPAGELVAECVDVPVPQGYRAVGPAVRFGPGVSATGRELRFSIPANAARVPARYASHVEVAWTPPGTNARARVVPVSDVIFNPEGTSLGFRGYRLGTYRAVVRDALPREVRRRVNYRGVYGISMGAVGASMLGVRDLARFDLIAALGGAADHTTSGHYLREYVFGGFCTAAERARLGDTACASSSLARTRPAPDLNYARQDFEHFFAPPGGGTGGTFDRRARFRGFRDIARMFGNPIMRADPSSRVVPLGVPASELSRSDAERCSAPVVLGGPTASMDARFYDDEFNPDGRAAAITFCDGGLAPGSVGDWDGGVGNYPVEIALAIDLNGNGRRDPGEPVVRNASEPYLDLGPDNLASRDEPGYDPVTNPDPAGDDYDRVYNPGGTEDNHERDEGERFEDLGLDGVACPAGRLCPYDAGEGNGVFDTSAGEGAVTRMNNPRTRLALAPQDEVLRVAQWLDGGVRDALQFGVNANHYAGVLAQRDAHLRVLDGFSSLTGQRASSVAAEGEFRPEDVPWSDLPARTLLRYGSLDASADDVRLGDGAHVGTNAQITNRLLASLLWASSRWPDGDTRFEPFTPSSDNEGRCAAGYTCAFDFRSERAGRTGQVVIVLPPGYHDPSNAGLRYPVLYLLHGYGMEPRGLAGTGLIAATRMVARDLPRWARPQKFIMVFPDGACRPGDGCQEGTFYVDSPAGTPRMEVFFNELSAWVESTFRVRAPEERSVTE
ncbi:MAG: hypothetical protein R3A48_25025 [Polyangiales bacterium]